MNDSELDDLLAAAIAPLPSAALEEAGRMADAARPRRTRRRALPARWVLPVILGGGLALTAGAATATVAISHWAGVSMPLENVRNTVPIAVDWTTDTGHAEQCRAWIELRNSEPGDRDALDAAIGARDWTGLGQRLYEGEAPRSGDDPDGETRVGRALTPALREFTATVFPGIHWFDDGVESADLTVDAVGLTCAPEQP